MDRYQSSRTIPEALGDSDIQRVIENLEAKWDAAQSAEATPDDRRQYTAAAHWAGPKLIAEIRRLQAIAIKEPDSR